MRLIILLSPAAIGYYVLRDLPVILKHESLARGLSQIILISALGLAISLFIQYSREVYKIKKRLGPKAYEWLIK
jgi:hypothetical protein